MNARTDDSRDGHEVLRHTLLNFVKIRQHFLKFIYAVPQVLLLGQLSSPNSSSGFRSVPPPAFHHSDEEAGWGFLLDSH